MPRYTPTQLTANLIHLRKWLATKKPREVVTDEMWDIDLCLGAKFLQAHGYPTARYFCTYGENAGQRFDAGSRFALVIHTLLKTAERRRHTAGAILKLIDRVNAMTTAAVEVKLNKN